MDVPSLYRFRLTLRKVCEVKTTNPNAVPCFSHSILRHHRGRPRSGERTRPPCSGKAPGHRLTTHNLLRPSAAHVTQGPGPKVSYCDSDSVGATPRRDFGFPKRRGSQGLAFSGEPETLEKETELNPTKANTGVKDLAQRTFLCDQNSQFCFP